MQEKNEENKEIKVIRKGKIPTRSAQEAISEAGGLKSGYATSYYDR